MGKVVKLPNSPKQGGFRRITFMQKFFCWRNVHEFEIEAKTTWNESWNGKPCGSGPMYVLRCKVCGKCKSEKL